MVILIILYLRIIDLNYIVNIDAYYITVEKPLNEHQFALPQKKLIGKTVENNVLPLSWKDIAKKLVFRIL